MQEKMRDWKVKLGSLGINCLEMTGDSEFFNKKAIQDSDLILTTPEVYVTTCFASYDLNKPLRLQTISLFIACRSSIL